MNILGNPTPIFRMFDERKAREFYIDFLGFTVDFEHKFEENFPLYMGISRGDCRIHLSEHHGDASPGSTVRIPVGNVETFSAELAAKSYKYAKPGGGSRTPWNTIEMELSDPFGNRLVFFQELKTPEQF